MVAQPSRPPHVRQQPRAPAARLLRSQLAPRLLLLRARVRQPSLPTPRRRPHRLPQWHRQPRLHRRPRPPRAHLFQVPRSQVPVRLRSRAPRVRATTRSAPSRACAPANRTTAVAAAAMVRELLVRVLRVQAAHARATTRSAPSRACAPRAARAARVHHATASAARVRAAQARAVHAHHATASAARVQLARAVHVQPVQVALVQPVRAVHVQPVPADHAQQAQAHRVRAAPLPPRA